MATGLRANDILHVVRETYIKLNLNYAQIFTDTLIVDDVTITQQAAYERITQLYNVHISLINNIILFSTNIPFRIIIDNLERGTVYVYIKSLYASVTLCDLFVLKDYYDIFYHLTTVIADFRIGELRHQCNECTLKYSDDTCHITPVKIINYTRYHQIEQWLRFLSDTSSYIKHVCDS